MVEALRHNAIAIGWLRAACMTDRPTEYDHSMDNRRIGDQKRFYSAIDRLTHCGGGARMLATCSGRLSWPSRGVYFFMENGEFRSDTGAGPRIVHVGTHALKSTSRTKLWNRLSQHRGQARTGGGNHRGSIFRLLIGTALMTRDGHACPTWDVGNSARSDVRAGELLLEREVSRYIGAMLFLWISIDDEPGRESLRGCIERNAIAILSNFDKDKVDAPSVTWLGRHCNRERVQEIGSLELKPRR